MSHHTNEIRQNWPSVAGCPVCYFEGDEVITKDGRKGTVLGIKWEHDLVIFQNDKVSKGVFLVTVDFEGYTENFLRHDLSGKRFARGGFW